MTKKLKALAACLALAASSASTAIPTERSVVDSVVAIRAAPNQLLSLDTRVPGERRAAESGPSAKSTGGGISARRELGPAAERHVPVTVLPIPEPGKWAVLLAGLLGVGAIARRRLPS